MNENNIIGIALDELYRIFDLLNQKYYFNKLSYPIITIQKSKRSGNLGWFTLDKVWENKENTDKKFEITICAEYLNRSIYEIITTLHHEMVHYANRVAGINDCNGQVHNKKFKRFAENVDLIVTYSKQYGYGNTSYSPSLKQFIDDEIKPNEKCFEYFRNLQPKQQNTVSQKKIFTYSCPQCNEKIKAKPERNILCCDCNRKFEMEELR